MVRSRTAVQVLLLMGVLVSGAFASPITYTFNFTVDSGSPAPTSGSFTYDSTAPLASRFTFFDVVWDGFTFDMTSNANSPFSVGCGPADSSTSFGELSGTLTCPGTPPVSWNGNATPSLAGFGFLTAGSGNEYQLAVGVPNPSDVAGNAGGSFGITINDQPPTPEPSSFILALTGGAFLARKRMRRATRKSTQMTH